jgi:hypothetical protein
MNFGACLFMTHRYLSYRFEMIETTIAIYLKFNCIIYSSQIFIFEL